MFALCIFLFQIHLSLRHLKLMTITNQAYSCFAFSLQKKTNFSVTILDLS